MPHDVSVEYAADINLLRLHDLKHGANYVNTATISDPCIIPDIDPANPRPENGSASCLTNLALEQSKPAVCQVCHYTPALDLAQVGPMAGPPGSTANGRNQLAHSSNSNVMHSHQANSPICSLRCLRLSSLRTAASPTRLCVWKYSRRPATRATPAKTFSVCAEQCSTAACCVTTVTAI